VRECAAGSAVDEDLEARRGMAGAHAHVVGRAFIAEAGGHGVVHRKVRGVGKGEAQAGAPYLAIPARGAAW